MPRQARRAEEIIFMFNRFYRRRRGTRLVRLVRLVFGLEAVLKDVVGSVVDPMFVVVGGYYSRRRHRIPASTVLLDD